MKALLFVGALLCLVTPAGAQGITAAWDVRSFLEEFSAQTRRIQPLLDGIQPEQWVRKGAPAAYSDQLKSVRLDVAALNDSIARLRQDPEKLPRALEVLFRHERVERRIQSLVEGVRTYQNPALASLLTSTLAENASNRERLQDYVSDLAATKDAEFAIMDREAQRCRGQLNKTVRKD
jgi:hypothetical protein